MTIAQAPVALRQPIDGRHRRMFVDGAWLDARSGRIMETRNPATGAVIATVPRGDRDDIELAVAAARRAFDGPWSRYKPYERQVLLLRIADLFEKHWEEISRSDTTDMGMPIVRTLANRNRVIGMLRYYAGMATSLHGETIENSLPGEIVSFTRKEPVGVVGAIIPWNAPTAASIWKIGPALAAGCTVVLKPSEEAPLTPLLVADIMNEAGVPPGVVNIVTGTGAEAGAALAEHVGVDKIVFTGSTATGQSIVRASAGNLKRVSLELGGKSPVIVCADADLDRAVPVAAMSVFANSGQICIAGSRLFVERSIHDEFVERLAVYAKGLRIGDGIDPATEIGPLVSEKQLQRVASYLEAGTAEGATLVTGGERLMEGALAAGNFLAPTVFADVSDDMRIAREEIFGPVISALPFDTLDEAVERANNTPYGLAAGVFTQNLATAHQLSRKIRAGSVWVNTYHAIDPAMPFGGYKMSGYGREGGAEHLDDYLNTKGVFIKID
ncbi:MAG: aldehyde dehydrogenase family protein [Mesorhizobium sp.]|uniref:aldehyde dehydrogenase family protein n=2 Tax=Mesorhizobium TaxID=68287 RepID=UPI000FE97BFF|nr:MULTISPECIES: aldehyde dehydrogenase family protein [unclassified Mesorhizobium]RWB29733.1 MAG: aldehyde dehydrogenase family protein [Mesorhizobium sp.]RWB66435.1 MAG: aldehyde dehydrogenase family protein [Mesorhizobium sp.]RWF56260.1 MAG: aldehyde dehydrogenase family protein [Mesorhizobium sp.]TGT94145.1 aldehyde dehydrogenase family protein [Mesorhizobium sp. M5C.F.Ca.ET.164.01.1.1]TIS39472.1 MAG: aldehyde dehydrogenase family protein [Mesorhizobium sp.]